MYTHCNKVTCCKIVGLILQVYWVEPFKQGVVQAKVHLCS